MIPEQDNIKTFSTPEGHAWLKAMLRAGPADITFIKKDGTERVMKCTLQEDVAVPHIKTTDRKSREESTEVLPVWDIEKGAWRSFRLDTIKQVSFDI